MSSFAIRTISVSANTASTSASTGAIICAGGMGISGNVTVGGNVVTGGTISGSTLSTSSTLTLYDGLNVGTISQLGPDLTLSSSGNKIAIASNNTLLFKNDNTTQLTAYTSREIVDDCDTHTYIHNIANPSNLRYMLSSTFALNQGVPSTFSITATNAYAYPIRLIKGQVVTGAGFYLSYTGSPQIYYALYDTANTANRIALTALTTPSTSTGMNYINYTSSYTVPATGIYYTCIYVNSVGTGLNLIAMPSNTYLNYGISAMTTGVFNKAAQSAATGSGGPPSTMSGVAMTLLDRVAYSVVYTS